MTRRWQMLRFIIALASLNQELRSFEILESHGTVETCVPFAGIKLAHGTGTLRVSTNLSTDEDAFGDLGILFQADQHAGHDYKIGRKTPTVEQGRF